MAAFNESMQCICAYTPRTYPCVYALRTHCQVYRSLPDSLQQAFASQNVALVELALSLLVDQVGEQELERLLRRCLKAGFWDDVVSY